ncbi:cupin domain-containing protein [Streptacidiphilus jiangxiensis]|uniref:Cupin domain protein n=1 Tax=Streptacidiphilus jiangxiensis TaxID=235985 RepID=A0A1H7S228_STRJI|nr:cupin domain-containing protein [Streptacidiphilus jiangxiensis]SEL66660.1 Cupin domain protein [Streptacidiphilus jiangxiensis]
MPVVHKEEAKTHELHGARFVTYANPAAGSQELCAWRTEIPAGTTGQAHTVTREEILLVLRGSLRFTVDAETHELTAGDVLIANPSSTLRVDNASDEPAHIWATTTIGLEAVMADGTRVRPPWANA